MFSLAGTHLRSFALGLALDGTDSFSNTRLVFESTDSCFNSRTHFQRRRPVFEVTFVFTLLLLLHELGPCSHTHSPSLICVCSVICARRHSFVLVHAHRARLRSPTRSHPAHPFFFMPTHSRAHRLVLVTVQDLSRKDEIPAIAVKPHGALLPPAFVCTSLNHLDSFSTVHTHFRLSAFVFDCPHASSTVRIHFRLSAPIFDRPHSFSTFHTRFRPSALSFTRFQPSALVFDCLHLFSTIHACFRSSVLVCSY